MLLRQYRKTIRAGRSVDRSTEIICLACRQIKPLAGSKPGSVFAGMVVKTIESVEVHGELQASGFDTLESVQVVQKKIRFPGREKGIICLECQANTHWVEAENGTQHPWIKLDTEPIVDRREWFTNERSVEYAEGTGFQLGKVTLRFRKD